MSSPTTPADLLDLKMLPAWASEPSRPNEYADFQGEDFDGGDRRGGRRDRGDQRGPRRNVGNRQRNDRDGGGARPPQRRDRDRQSRPDRRERTGPDAGSRGPAREPLVLPAVDVRFLPHAPAFNNVIAQIKSGSVAYSVFALARLFLEKPERYDVRITGSEAVQLFQLGEDGAVATDARVLESNAFASSLEQFYNVETTQTEPLKGNFTNVARCRLSGTLLGPTNYHSYQPQLRSLYEQRFSRRMSFADYQRQIEVVSDPAVVEEWKEQARSVTRYTTKNEEPPVVLNTLAEAERHFRQHYLPGLMRTATELTIGGVVSRQLPDRGLRRAIEEAWVRETRSPSRMMQELAGGLRGSGLHIFRHRRGMLFVSPIRGRAFGHDRSSVSASINSVLEKISATPGIGRKQLADELAPAGVEGEDADRAKRTLASDLRWLISEGYVIEFNDGSLDLPRTKPPEANAGNAQTEAATGEGEPAPANAVENISANAEATAPAAEPAATDPQPDATEPTMAAEQTVPEAPADEQQPAS